MMGARPGAWTGGLLGGGGRGGGEREERGDEALSEGLGGQAAL